jgi:hypothetical protein
MDIVDKYLNDQAKAEVKRHITFSKTDDNLFVFYKDSYDPDTGEILPDKEVIATITKKEVKNRIDENQAELAKLQEFLAIIKEL